MTREDLVEALAKRGGITRKKARQVVDIFFDGISQAIHRGEQVEFRNFGTFTARDYPGYTGRNPRTGESIPVGEKRLPFFKPGRELRRRVLGEEG